MLVTLGLVAASLSLSAWWAQAIAAREIPVLTSAALRSIDSFVASRLQAQAAAGGLSPRARTSALAALGSPAVRQAVASGGAGRAVEAALEKADPGLAPVFKSVAPTGLPPIGRIAVRDARRIPPLAETGMLLAAALCALALAVAADRFRVLRRMGWWGVTAGGLSLLAGWLVPSALGLGRSAGTAGEVTRAALGAALALRALSETLVVAGAALVVFGMPGGALADRLMPARGAGPVDRPGAAGGIGLPPRATRAAPRRVYGAMSSSKVDVRL